MRNRIFIFLGVIVWALKLTGQTGNHFKQIGELQGEFVLVKPDILGNIFVLTNTGQLKKYNTAFDSVGVFNEVRRYGPLQQISIDNPLRTILYFKSYKTVLVLDRFMQIVNKIDLRNSALFQVNAVAQSYDNKIWAFDEQEAKLKKINELGKVEMESGDLRMLAGINPGVDVIFELDKFVCLYDRQNGLIIFDQFCGYRNIIPIVGWSTVHGIGEFVLGIENNKLVGYSFRTKQTSSLMDLSGKENLDGNQVIICGQRMYITGKQGVYIYQLPSQGN